MYQVIGWIGFLGAWLLVAGPLYQGALELREQEIDREGIEASTASIPRPQSPSPWWWLFPPAFYVISNRRGKAYRAAVLAQLSPEHRHQFTTFISKATGWFAVAIGATLLAIDQTWSAVERQHWPVWVFGVLIVVPLGLSVSNTAYQMSQAEQRAEAGEKPAA
jgi:hypothetical protein